jgi:hypothetical protein
MYQLGAMFISLVLLVVLSSTIVKVSVGHHPATAMTTACGLDDDLSVTVKRLASPLSDLEMDQVKRVLLSNAKRSPKCRQLVIAALMRAMDQPDLDLLRGQGSYDIWTHGAQLLGELKAVEALDLLIAHLNSTDGLSINMNHFPAVGGVIAMGPIAIPKLAAALQQNPDRYVRKHALFCIASIGGNSAKLTLNQALHSESDRCNREFIEVSLNAFKNKRTPNRIIFDPERSTWYAALYCHD